MMTFGFRILDSGKILTRGVAFDGRLREVWSQDGLMVWHKASATAWSSRGETATDPALYMVLEELEPLTPGLRRARIVKEFPSGRSGSGHSWRQAKAAAIDAATQLAKANRVDRSTLGGE